MNDDMQRDLKRELKRRQREARQDIIELFNRYSDAVPRRDWDQYGSVFAEDGIWEYAEFGVRCEGRKNIVETISQSIAENIRFSTQYIGALHVEFPDESLLTARSRTWFSEWCIALVKDSPMNFFGLATYYDDLVCIDEEWKIKHRRVVTSYMEPGPLPGRVYPRADREGRLP